LYKRVSTYCFCAGLASVFFLALFFVLAIIEICRTLTKDLRYKIEGKMKVEALILRRANVALAHSGRGLADKKPH
jgi:hypothetical protein